MKKFIGLISILLILGGLVLILGPSISSIIVEKNLEKNYKNIDKLTKEDFVNNNSKEAVFDYESIVDVNLISGVNKVRKPPNHEGIIGQIYIESLNIDIPILKGVTNENLLYGSTTLRPDQIMGENNYPIIGHNMRNKNLLFGSLSHIKIDDKVKITNKDKIYEYRIYHTDIIHASNSHVLSEDYQGHRGKSIITLITCHGSFRTSDRFIAVGELVDSYSYSVEGFR